MELYHNLQDCKTARHGAWRLFQVTREDIRHHPDMITPMIEILQ